jgi:hypothetical protein
MFLYFELNLDRQLNPDTALPGEGDDWKLINRNPLRYFFTASN